MRSRNGLAPDAHSGTFWAGRPVTSVVLPPSLCLSAVSHQQSPFLGPKGSFRDRVDRRTRGHGPSQQAADLGSTRPARTAGCTSLSPAPALPAGAPETVAGQEALIPKVMPHLPHLTCPSPARGRQAPRLTFPLCCQPGALRMPLLSPSHPPCGTKSCLPEAERCPPLPLSPTYSHQCLRPPSPCPLLCTQPLRACVKPVAPLWAVMSLTWPLISCATCQPLQPRLHQAHPPEPHTRFRVHSRCCPKPHGFQEMVSPLSLPSLQC